MDNIPRLILYGLVNSNANPQLRVLKIDKFIISNK